MADRPKFDSVGVPRTLRCLKAQFLMYSDARALTPVVIHESLVLNVTTQKMRDTVLRKLEEKRKR